MSIGQLPQSDQESAEDFDARNYEVINGQRVELPPMSAREIDLASHLLVLMGNAVRKSGKVHMEMLYLLDPKTNLQRRPDVAFVSYARWPRGRPVPTTNAWEVVPDLAVEVVSFTNTANEMLMKLHDYFRCGVRLVWVVYPLFEQIYLYTSTTAVAILSYNDTLEGGSVLPGFTLPLAELFEREELADE